MSWAVEQDNADRFFEECIRAAQEENVFNEFRRLPGIVECVENQSPEHGMAHCRVLKRVFPETLAKARFLTVNERTGNPANMVEFNHYFQDRGEWRHAVLHLSATTWRYVCRAAELTRMFGSLNGMTIAEIGGGYGGMCRVIRTLWPWTQYTIYDDSRVSGLQRRYLDTCGVGYGVRVSSNPQDVSGECDLLISDFALGELDAEGRDSYVPLLKSAKRLAVAWPYRVYPERFSLPQEVWNWLHRVAPDKTIVWGAELPLYQNICAAFYLNTMAAIDPGRWNFFWGLSEERRDEDSCDMRNIQSTKTSCKDDSVLREPDVPESGNGNSG